MQQFSREINKPPHEKHRKLIQSARDVFLTNAGEDGVKPEYLAIHGSAWYLQKKNPSMDPRDVDLIIFSKPPSKTTLSYLKEFAWFNDNKYGIDIDASSFYTPEATEVGHHDFADLLGSLHLGKIIAANLKQYSAFAKKRTELLELMKKRLKKADEKQVKNVLTKLEIFFKKLQEHVSKKISGTNRNSSY